MQTNITTRSVLQGWRTYIGRLAIGPACLSFDTARKWQSVNSARLGAIESLRNLARHRTHGGYVWAAVTHDGELLCVPCVRENYKQILRATIDASRDGWAVQGITNSGESESTEYCAHCGRAIWEHDE